MNTKLSKSILCAALLAIVLTAGGYSATKSYIGFNDQIRSSERLMAECESMYQTVSLNEFQIQARNDASHRVFQSLDSLIDANIESIKAQLASSDPQAQAMAKAVLKHIAHRRAQAEAVKALSANR